MNLVSDIKLFFGVKTLVKDAGNVLTEVKPMKSSLWSKFIVVFHTVGPQILNLVLIAKDMVPPKWGAVISAALGFGSYAVHVYHDVKAGGVQALATDAQALTPVTK